MENSAGSSSNPQASSKKATEKTGPQSAQAYVEGLEPTSDDSRFTSFQVDLQPRPQGSFGAMEATRQTPQQHALQDYQMQLMLLEQQKKKKIIQVNQNRSEMRAAKAADPKPPTVSSRPRKGKTPRAPKTRKTPGGSTVNFSDTGTELKISTDGDPGPSNMPGGNVVPCKPDVKTNLIRQ